MEAFPEVGNVYLQWAVSLLRCFRFPQNLSTTLDFFFCMSQGLQTKAFSQEVRLLACSLKAISSWRKKKSLACYIGEGGIVNSLIVIVRGYKQAETGKNKRGDESYDVHVAYTIIVVLVKPFLILPLHLNWCGIQAGQTCSHPRSSPFIFFFFLVSCGGDT